MKHLPSFTLVTLLVVLLVMPAFAADMKYANPDLTLSQGQQEQAIKKINRALAGILAAADARDADALGEFFTKETTFIDASGVTVGWEIYREKNLEAQFATVREGADQTHAMTGALTTLLSDKTAYTMYTFTMDAEVGDVFGAGSVVFKNIDGSWKAVHVQSSARMLAEGEVPPAIKGNFE